MIDFLISHGIHVIGFASDGDNQYSTISRGFMNGLMNNIHERAERIVSEIFSLFNKNCHFSDLFHLVKRDRYRKVSKDYFHVDPWNESSHYTVDDLIEIGISVYLLCGEQARKMDDSLPIKLFSKNILSLILNEDDPGLFFAMLPSTLILESIHSKSATRNQRIDFLMIGASLMILYELYKKIHSGAKIRIGGNRCKTNPEQGPMLHH